GKTWERWVVDDFKRWRQDLHQRKRERKLGNLGKFVYEMTGQVTEPNHMLELREEMHEVLPS
ncbi:hypothetical protein ACLOJK_004263, partial [Asimina triloba]